MKLREPTAKSIRGNRRASMNRSKGRFPVNEGCLLGYHCQCPLREIHRGILPCTTLTHELCSHEGATAIARHPFVRFHSLPQTDAKIAFFCPDGGPTPRSVAPAACAAPLSGGIGRVTDWPSGSPRESPIRLRWLRQSGGALGGVQAAAPGVTFAGASAPSPCTAPPAGTPGGGSSGGCPPRR